MTSRASRRPPSARPARPASTSAPCEAATRATGAATRFPAGPASRTRRASPGHRDGLIICAATADLDPESMAALGAASLGLAQRMAAEVGKGLLRQAVTRSSAGYVAIYAVGSAARLNLAGPVSPG